MIKNEEEAPVVAPKKTEPVAPPAPVEPVQVDNSPVTRAEFEALKALFRKTEGDVAYIRRRVG